MTTRSAIRYTLSRLGLLPLAWRVRARLDPVREKSYQAQRAALDALAGSLGASYSDRIRSMRVDRTVLVSAMPSVNAVALQSPLLAAFTRAGYRPVVLLFESNPCLMKAYRLFGVDRFVHFGQFVRESVSRSVRDKALNDLRSGRPLSDIVHEGCMVGKYVLSWHMRSTRQGDPDIESTEALDRLLPELDEGLAFAEAARAVIEHVRPAAGLLIDIGYSPSGQFFDRFMALGLPCFSWNSSHRNGSLTLKRYTSENRHMHPASLSDATWTRLKAMPWDDDRLREVCGELDGCYRSGQWFPSAGTQTSKIFPSPDELRARLGLDPARKTAVIFPHIFWDSTFFWGQDLFRNFEDWFKQTLRAAAANTSLNWLVKVHPANAVKDLLDGYQGEGSEEKAIRETLGRLPAHVTLLPASSEIATASLFPVMDYCLTVRGTVGIEAAINGVRTLTAGTGRYDRRGFTVDSNSAGEYLKLISRLHDVPSMSEEEVRLARRFAYGLFIARPAPLGNLTFRFRPDARASLVIDIKDGKAQDPAGDPAVANIASWIASGEEDFIQPGILS